MEISAALIIIVFNFILQQISGSLAVSAYSIVANLAIMVIAVFSGVAQDLQPLVSTNYGANQFQRTHRVLRYALIITGGIGLVVYGIAYTIPEVLISFFNTDTVELVPIAKQAIRLYMLAFFVSGMNMVMIAYLQAIQQTRIAFIFSLLRGFVGVALNLAWLVPLFTIQGVWITIPVTEGIVFVLLGWYTQQYVKQQKSEEC